MVAWLHLFITKNFILYDLNIYYLQCFNKMITNENDNYIKPKI